MKIVYRVLALITISGEILASALKDAINKLRLKSSSELEEAEKEIRKAFKIER